MSALSPAGAVARVKSLAVQYCQVIEVAESVTADELLAQLHHLLPALIATVQELPETEPATDEPGPDISHEDWSSRFAALNKTLGERGHYWTTSEMLGRDEPAPVLLPLADDLADIWRDLKSTLTLLAAGGSPDDAVWQWRFDFSTHWGAHASEALRAIHALAREQ